MSKTLYTVKCKNGQHEITKYALANSCADAVADVKRRFESSMMMDGYNHFNAFVTGRSGEGYNMFIASWLSKPYIGRGVWQHQMYTEPVIGFNKDDAKKFALALIDEDCDEKSISIRPVPDIAGHVIAIMP